MDTIEIRGLEVYAHHGLYDFEAENGQNFVIDCDIKLDISTCKENIHETVHYGDLSMDIVSFVKGNRYDLLETLVNDLAKNILNKYKKISELKLKVHKPQAPIPTKFTDVSLVIERSRNIVYLGIGSNLGDRKEYLDMVVKAIELDENIVLKKVSNYIETKAYGVEDQADFLNAVLKVETIYTPQELLLWGQKLEEKALRVRSRKWGERTLDVDILFYGELQIFTDTLKIPHPEVHLREFVLRSMKEIEPYFIHPVYRKSIKEF